MPLTWDRAYGGRDLHAEQLMQITPGRARWRPADSRNGLGLLTYPRNGAGCGYYLDVDRDRIHGTPAPNLEDEFVQLVNLEVDACGLTANFSG